MQTTQLEATAVVRKNSIGFIEQVFKLYEARRPLVLVADEEQATTLSGIHIDQCIVPDERSGWFTGHYPIIDDDLPAQVTYTSGTEGKPKGILLSYANLADATHRIIDQMRMTADLREYVGVPATFSFGMGRYRAISAVGGQAYLPPRGFDPLELARMLSAGQVNSLSVVPTLLRIILAAPAVIGEAGKYLRWMEIGSQYMTADEKRRVRELFPNAIIIQHYGLTEASRSTFLTISEARPEELESVGRAVGQTELALSPRHHIRIRGPHVARWRIDADGLHDLLDKDGWLQTNDLGHMQDGFLFYDGRADDLINSGGMKIVPDQLEEQIRARLAPGMRLAVAKVPDAQRGDGILVAVEAEPSARGPVREAARAALEKMGVSAGGSLHVMTLDALPVTGTGKVQRSVLAAQFVASQKDQAVAADVPVSGNNDVLTLFRREFPGQAVKPEDTFESLGGDSLRYIQFSLSFEQRFGQLPDDWEKMTTVELQQTIGQTGKRGFRRLEGVTLTRAFFMVCIVALHTDAFVYSNNWGAAYFLYLLAGYSVARFQLPEMIRTGSVTTLWGTIRFVALPTVLMVALLQILTQRFEITPLLLVSNFLDPNMLDGFLFYFVEIYVQLLVLAAIFFSFARVRGWFQARPMLSAVVLLVVVIVVQRFIESFYNADYNYHRTPWNYAWPFALGMVLAAANDLRTQMVALIVSCLVIVEFWGLTSAAFYVSGGCAVVLFVRALVVPAPVKVLVAEIAGASLFIYLFHYQMISIDEKLFEVKHPWGELFASIIVGVVAAHLYTWGERKLKQRSADDPAEAHVL